MTSRVCSACIAAFVFTIAIAFEPPLTRECGVGADGDGSKACRATNLTNGEALVQRKQTTGKLDVSTEDDEDKPEPSMPIRDPNQSPDVNEGAGASPVEPEVPESSDKETAEDFLDNVRGLNAGPNVSLISKGTSNSELVEKVSGASPTLADMDKCFTEEALREKKQAAHSGIGGLGAGLATALGDVPGVGAVAGGISEFGNALVDSAHQWQNADADNCVQMGMQLVSSQISKVDVTVTDIQKDVKAMNLQMDGLAADVMRNHNEVTAEAREARQSMERGLQKTVDLQRRSYLQGKRQLETMRTSEKNLVERMAELVHGQGTLSMKLDRILMRVKGLEQNIDKTSYASLSVQFMSAIARVGGAFEDFVNLAEEGINHKMSFGNLGMTQANLLAWGREDRRIGQTALSGLRGSWTRARDSFNNALAIVEEGDFFDLHYTAELSMALTGYFNELEQLVNRNPTNLCAYALENLNGLVDRVHELMTSDDFSDGNRGGMIEILVSAASRTMTVASAMDAAFGDGTVPVKEITRQAESVRRALASIKAMLTDSQKFLPLLQNALAAVLPSMCPDLPKACRTAAFDAGILAGDEIVHMGGESSGGDGPWKFAVSPSSQIGKGEATDFFECLLPEREMDSDPPASQYTRVHNTQMDSFVLHPTVNPYGLVGCKGRQRGGNNEGENQGTTSDAYTDGLKRCKGSLDVIVDRCTNTNNRSPLTIQCPINYHVVGTDSRTKIRSLACTAARRLGNPALCNEFTKYSAKSSECLGMKKELTITYTLDDLDAATASKCEVNPDAPRVVTEVSGLVYSWNSISLVLDPWDSLITKVIDAFNFGPSGLSVVTTQYLHGCEEADTRITTYEECKTAAAALRMRFDPYSGAFYNYGSRRRWDYRHSCLTRSVDGNTLVSLWRIKADVWDSDLANDICKASY